MPSPTCEDSFCSLPARMTTVRRTMYKWCRDKRFSWMDLARAALSRRPRRCLPLALANGRHPQPLLSNLTFEFQTYRDKIAGRDRVQIPADLTRNFARTAVF